MTARPSGGEPIGWRSALWATAVGTSRGGNQVAIKFTLEALSPLWAAFWRMVVSSGTVLTWAVVGKRSLRPTPGERIPLLVLGAIFTTQIAILNYGADLTSPAVAVILINTNPLFANLMAHFVAPEDRLSPRRVLGLLIAFSGVCVVFLGRPDARIAPNPLLGNALVVLSAALVAARTVYIQRLVQKTEPARALFWQMALSIPVFALGGWLVSDHAGRGPLTWVPTAALLYQGLIVGGLALIVWILLLKRHSAGTVSVFSFATPIAGVFLSAWLFGEALTARLFVGLLAVMAGVWFVTGERRDNQNLRDDD